MLKSRDLRAIKDRTKSKNKKMKSSWWLTRLSWVKSYMKATNRNKSLIVKDGISKILRWGWSYLCHLWALLTQRVLCRKSWLRPHPWWSKALQRQFRPSITQLAHTRRTRSPAATFQKTQMVATLRKHKMSRILLEIKAIKWTTPPSRWLNAWNKKASKRSLRLNLVSKRIFSRGSKWFNLAKITNFWFLKFSLNP